MTTNKPSLVGRLRPYKPFLLQLLVLPLYYVSHRLSSSYEAPLLSLTSLPLPTNAPSPTPSSLSEYLASLPSPTPYMAFLLAKLPAVVVTTYLLYFLINALSTSLYGAEEELMHLARQELQAQSSTADTTEKTKIEKELQERSHPIDVRYFRFVPGALLALELTESVLHGVASWGYDKATNEIWGSNSSTSSFLRVTAGVSTLHHRLTRLIIVFGVVTLAVGWMRVWVMRMKVGEKRGTDKVADAKPMGGLGQRKPPPGLTRAGMISDETWRAQNGENGERINRKKKKRA
ncbi:hypothetical protein BC832DRAFT_553278 [Gaertneriomyces semiglobifer]|nr:hypothetical protein BC832DRAFT_553278 [Gaertneriomyces semiglobifer]